MQSCINMQHVWCRIRIKIVAKVLKSGCMHNWINYSWLTVSFSIVCLTGPAVRVFLVLRNHCVPGRLLNSVLGAEAWQLWHCCNNYQPSLLSPPLIPVQCTALLVGVSFTHGESLKNPLHLSFVCQTSRRIGSFAIYFFYPRAYSIQGHGP